MKHLLPILLILVGTSGRAQTYVKGTGIAYYDTRPVAAPKLKRGSELAYALDDQTLYYWRRDSARWEAYQPAGGVTLDTALLVTISRLDGELSRLREYSDAQPRNAAYTGVTAINYQDAADRGVKRNQEFIAGQPNTMGEQPGTLIICLTCPEGQ